MSLMDEFESTGYVVLTASSGSEGLVLAREKKPDLIILDIMLPGLDGYDVCKQLRAERNHTPIIMLTVKNTEIDKVLGLELGADDYVTKPFSVRELSARVKTIFRRIESYAADTSITSVGDITINFKKYKASRRGRNIDFTPLEYQLLQVFVKNRGIVLTRDRLLEQVWGEDNVVISLRTIDSHVAAIRKKLEDDPANPIHIVNIRGVGYKLTDP